jgi:hypothetical protein
VRLTTLIAFNLEEKLQARLRANGVAMARVLTPEIFLLEKGSGRGGHKT